MALFPDYATLAELKSQLRIPDADTVDNTELANAITAASRAIDHFANRQFGEGSVVARVYTWRATDLLEGRPALAVDDIHTATGLVLKVDEDDDGTYERTVAATDYNLYPYNALVVGRPWTHIVLRRTGTVTRFPTGERGVEVTADYGWASVPVAIKQATLLQAQRFFARRNAPFGIAGSPEVGSEMRLLAQLDPDVKTIVNAYRRHWAAV